MAIDGQLNTTDLCSREGSLWIENGRSFSDVEVEHTARIGLNSVPEPWRSIPWRFVVKKGALDG